MVSMCIARPAMQKNKLATTTAAVAAAEQQHGNFANRPKNYAKNGKMCCQKFSENK
jgi:glycine/serine hydroxymethyltransferase